MANRITVALKAVLLTTILLVIALVFPATRIESQESKSSQQNANQSQNPKSSQGTQGTSEKRKVKVTATRITKAKLSAAAIKTFGTDEQLKRFVRVTGNSIAAAKGYMLLKLKKTKVILITSDSGAPSGSTVYAEAVSNTSFVVTVGDVVMVTKVRAC